MNVRRTLASVSLALALLAPAAASAQQSGAARPQFGFGVTVSPVQAQLLAGAIDILVPIQVAPDLRVEPTLGILTSDNDAQYERIFALGAGVFMQKRVESSTDLHFGGRLKLAFAKVDVDGVGDDSGTDIVLAAAAGAEHFLGNHFSVGLEAQLGYYSSWSLGEASGFFTSGMMTLRTYF